MGERRAAVIGSAPCGCITYIDLDPSNLVSAHAAAGRGGRKVEVLGPEDALARWRAQDTVDCRECARGRVEG